jgi:DNA repair protein RadD
MTSQLPFGTVASLIVPRYYQDAATEALWRDMRDHSPVAVLPTGSGKSIIVAQLCQKTFDAGGRVIVLHPRKELIEQNAAECRALMPGVDVGLYSAGLSKRHTEHAIVFAGIQSCFDKAHLFGSRDVIIADECHLLPPDGEGRYRTFLHDLKALCPHSRFCGLTATAFRTGSGALCGPQNLLTKVAYTASVSRLMTEGYLCPIINRPMASELDTSGLKILSRTQEFDAGDSERLFDTDDKVNEAVAEILSKTIDRHSVLLFCSGVKHAGHVADVLATMSGERVGLVTGETMPLERSNLLSMFKAGTLRWLVNVDVLTTGFNAQRIDCICVLRATASPGLFAQICGRGFRVHESKGNCLVLDLGQNIARHGPIDADDYGIQKPKEKRDAMAGMPSKECPSCAEPQQIQAKVCTECGFEWPAKPRHDANADIESAILESQIEPTEYLVESATFSRHVKRDAPDAPNTLRIDYVCELADGGGNLTRKTISEWVCVDHVGFPKRNAIKWWRERSLAELVEDEQGSLIDPAIDLWKRGAVVVASRLWVVPKGKFTQIVQQEITDERPEEWRAEYEPGEEAFDPFEAVEVPF